MNKTTAGLTLTAITGLGLFAATPALAVDPATASLPPYANCDEARADGRTNILSTDPRFQPRLDGDGDGVGCDEDQPPTPTPSPTTPMPSPTAPPTMQPTQPGTPGGQVGRVPAGGANTGIAQEPEESRAGILALGGGLVLVAAAGGTFVVRRRHEGQE